MDHYVHMNKGKIKHMEITEQFLNQAANVTNVRISYGGETGGQREFHILYVYTSIRYDI